MKNNQNKAKNAILDHSLFKPIHLINNSLCALITTLGTFAHKVMPILSALWSIRAIALLPIIKDFLV